MREYFVDELLTAPGFWDRASEVAVLGGIMVNRGVGGDRFAFLKTCVFERELRAVARREKAAAGRPARW